MSSLRKGLIGRIHQDLGYSFENDIAQANGKEIFAPRLGMKTRRLILISLGLS